MFDGKQLRAKRESEKLSASQLAEMLGTTKENIYKWEGGTVPHNKQQIAAIENWLNGGVKLAPKESSNGIDYKTKYYDLLEKYTALLEKSS